MFFITLTWNSIVQSMGVVRLNEHKYIYINSKKDQNYNSKTKNDDKLAKVK